jgi:type IV pilus assembly protein PilO
MKPILMSGIILAVLAGYTGYHGIFVPTQRQIKRLDTQLAEAKATQEVRERVAGSLNEFERLRKQLPQDASTEWLLREVTKRAQEEGIQLQSILPQDRRDLRDASELSVHLQLSSSYHQLGKFVSSLERSTPLIWIEECAITKSGQDLPQIRLVVSTLYVPAMSP